MTIMTSSRTEDVFLAVTREKPRLLGYIRQRTEDAAEVEDIYQEAVLKMAKRVDSGHRVTDPIKYAYQVIANIIRDNYRRRQGESQETLTEDILCQRPLPEQQLEAQERLKLFVSYLNTLPSRTRQIIILRKLHGASYREIAEELNLSEHSVEKRLNRAMRKLEATMSKYTVTPEEQSRLSLLKGGRP